jgi:hypothetical protein
MPFPLRALSLSANLQQSRQTRATYTVGKGRAVYTKRDIDFIAAHSLS